MPHSNRTQDSSSLLSPANTYRRTPRRTTLIGLLLRLGLIAKWGVRLTRRQSRAGLTSGADNFVDAAAMAIVADEWLRRADISVITDADGTRKRCRATGSVIT